VWETKFHTHTTQPVKLPWVLLTFVIPPFGVVSFLHTPMWGYELSWYTPVTLWTHFRDRKCCWYCSYRHPPPPHTQCLPSTRLSVCVSVSGNALYSSLLHNTNHCILIIRRGASPSPHRSDTRASHSCAGKYSEPPIDIIFRCYLILSLRNTNNFCLEDGGNTLHQNDWMNCLQKYAGSHPRLSLFSF
jgi:hypothetical protein